MVMTKTIEMGTVRTLPAMSEPLMSLTTALKTRRSVRTYSAQPLDEGDLAYVLWSAAGITASDGSRTTPSTMHRAALDPYVIDADGVWRYDAQKNELVCVATGDHRLDSTLGQDFVGTAPVTILLAADKAKGEGIEAWFGTDAGCGAMAIQLAACALGLGSVIRGSFDKSKMTASLGADAEKKVPVLCVTVGRGQ